RGSDFRSGYQDVTLRHRGLEVYPRLAAAEHGHAFRKEAISSGIAGLDALLGGGIDRGAATLIVGAPGSGKSTVALQFVAAAAARGDHAAIFTFEESRSSLLARAGAIGLRIEEGTAKGQVSIHQVDPTDIAPGEFAHFVRESVER